MNLARLEALSNQNPDEGVIDLTSMGYAKLLGTGKLTKALSVKVESASKSAIEKIEQAGGKILTAAPEASGE
jgi:large subunit ribosomal protein L15